MNSRAMDLPKVSKREFLQWMCAGVGGCLLGRDGFAALLEHPAFGASARPDEQWKWSTKALFCVDTEGGVKCLKCPHGCVLPPGGVGRCRNRVNYNGTVYSIAYGNPCAVHIDPIEKKPFFHFLPSARAFSIAVAGCNLRCLNCQNWEISQKSPRETENADLFPDTVVEAAARSECATIAYTYSEPVTFYEYAYDTSVSARERGIRNLWKSSGYINEKPLRELCTVIDAANIDLKGFDDDIYRKLNSARLTPVLNALKVFHEEGVWLEITNLVVPTWTDDLDTIGRMADWLVGNGLQDCPLHFSRFMPLYKLAHLPVTPVFTLERAREIALQAGMRYVYIGNVPAHDAENTRCHACGALVIERRGFTVLRNTLKNGTCASCGVRIPGVWA